MDKPAGVYFYFRTRLGVLFIYTYYHFISLEYLEFITSVISEYVRRHIIFEFADHVVLSFLRLRCK